MNHAVLKTPLLWLAATCAACALTLMFFGDFEGALLGAVSGAVLYWAHEKVRIGSESDR